MVDEPQAEFDGRAEAGESEQEAPERLTQAVRRERLGELSNRIGEHAVVDGDRVVVEVGEPVILHLELDRDGIYTATWWATALTDNAHHRWREAAEPLLRDGESVHTSALGGGYLVEVVRTTRDEQELLAWAGERGPVERVQELLAQFPEAVAKLPPEPVPDYLLPPEPELPPLGEVEPSDDGGAPESESEEPEDQ